MQKEVSISVLAIDFKLEDFQPVEEPLLEVLRRTTEMKMETSICILPNESKLEEPY